jgi:hypothetical protein
MNRQSCTTHSTSSAGSTAAADCTCNNGYYKNGSACSECGANYYCSGGTSRIACSGGKTTNGATTAYQVSSCACPSGLSDVSGVCTLLCSAGQYKNGSSCTNCPADQYQTLTSHSNTTCNLCSTISTNRSTNGGTGKTAATDCKCNAGYYGANGSGSCTGCNQSGSTGWTSTYGTTAVSSCTYIFSNKTVLTASQNKRADGTAAWTLPSMSSGPGVSSSGTLEARCNSSGSSNTITTPSNSGNYCYCRAKNSNGVWSSWGLCNSDYSNACSLYCGTFCAYTSYFSSYWGGRASW